MCKYCGVMAGGTTHATSVIHLCSSWWLEVYEAPKPSSPPPGHDWDRTLRGAPSKRRRHGASTPASPKDRQHWQTRRSIRSFHSQRLECERRELIEPAKSDANSKIGLGHLIIGMAEHRRQSGQSPSVRPFSCQDATRLALFARTKRSDQWRKRRGSLSSWIGFIVESYSASFAEFDFVK